MTPDDSAGDTGSVEPGSVEPDLVEPAGAEAAYRLGLDAHRQGRLDAAETHYGEALRLDPRHFHALHWMGVIALQRGDPGRARGWLAAAVAIDARHAAARNHYGNALLELQRPLAALAEYDAAVALAPDLADAHYNRGNALLDLRDYAAALASYDRAIAAKPDMVWAHNNRGLALALGNRHADALIAFDAALALQPGNADAYHYRGNSLQELLRHEAAVASYDRAIELNPAHAEAHQARGNALAQMQQPAPALASYIQALALAPATPFLPGMCLHMRMLLCDWRDFDADVARIAAALRQDHPASPPLPLLSVLDSAPLQRRAAELWSSKECPPNPLLGIPGPWPRHHRLRIGYFSADFREHPVAQLLAEVIERHARTRFEVWGFAWGPHGEDAMRRRLEQGFEHFLDVRHASDQEIATRARELQIDIAVDLGGFTQHARPRIFALRAAPLQVGFLGYPGTLGAEFMDYLIADPTVIPASCFAHYREKIIQLPDSFLPRSCAETAAATRAENGARARGEPRAASCAETRESGADRAPTRADCGLPERGFVYCCFNASYKITPVTFSAWMRILGRVPGSVLWMSQMSATAVGNLLREAARRGVDPRRLVFAERLQSRARHLARQNLADLFLDTLPYNAHATASDALWAGLPVLTLPGEGFAARVAASLLKAIGLPELIAADPARYEDLAVALATDPDRLAALAARLAVNRHTAPLFDMRAYTLHLETAYTVIHGRHRAGLPPAHLAGESMSG